MIPNVRSRIKLIHQIKNLTNTANPKRLNTTGTPAKLLILIRIIFTIKAFGTIFTKINSTGNPRGIEKIIAPKVR